MMTADRCCDLRDIREPFYKWSISGDLFESVPQNEGPRQAGPHTSGEQRGDGAEMRADMRRARLIARAFTLQDAGPSAAGYFRLRLRSSLVTACSTVSPPDGCHFKALVFFAT